MVMSWELNLGLWKSSRCFLTHLSSLSSVLFIYFFETRSLASLELQKRLVWLAGELSASSAPWLPCLASNGCDDSPHITWHLQAAGRDERVASDLGSSRSSLPL